MDSGHNKDSARKNIITKYHVKGNAKILITIGRIDPVGKNLIKLVEAVDIIRKTDTDFHLFLIGESNFPNSHLVPEEISKRHLTEFITLTGYIEIDELNLFYNAADALVFPSIYEGFGLPLLESMKCELPVICSDIEVFHEVAGNAAVYFKPQDTIDMTDKITLVLHNDIERSRLIENGKQRLAMFTWEKAANQLLDIIRTI